MLSQKILGLLNKNARTKTEDLFPDIKSQLLKIHEAATKMPNS